MRARFDTIYAENEEEYIKVTNFFITLRLLLYKIKIKRQYLIQEDPGFQEK